MILCAKKIHRTLLESGILKRRPERLAPIPL
jgi:hypothetical protein